MSEEEKKRARVTRDAPSLFLKIIENSCALCSLFWILGIILHHGPAQAFQARAAQAEEEGAKAQAIPFVGRNHG
jgi:hypothetical protein